jgi:uncharacterized protein YjiS (DUF1127 family)
MTTMIKTMTMPAATAAMTQMPARAFNTVVNFIVRYRNRAAVLHLADLDDHLLQDIGISRSDLRAIRGLQWRDPGAALADARARQEAARQL